MNKKKIIGAFIAGIIALTSSVPVFALDSRANTKTPDTSKTEDTKNTNKHSEEKGKCKDPKGNDNKSPNSESNPKQLDKSKTKNS